VSGPELSSLQSLEDKHLRVLGRHGITDLRGLVDADRENIHRAMANLRPRPPRDQIARWQDEARGLLAEAAAGDSDAVDDPDYPAWRPAASFVVVFLERRVNRGQERRVEAERTEVEPERNAEAWPGWEIGPVFDWMLGQLPPIASDGPDGSDGPSTGGENGESVQPAEQGTGAAEPALRRPALRIDGAVLIDVAGRESVPVAGPPVRELVAPARVAFTVSGARPKTRLLAVARVLRPDGPGWNAQDPVAVPGSGRVELDLSAIPEGEHDISLIAWAPDATAMPVSVQLPTLAIRFG
jgi:hypothetical protein